MFINRFLRIFILVILILMTSVSAVAKDELYSPEQCLPYGSCEQLRPLFQWPELRNIFDEPIITPTFCLQVALDRDFDDLVYELNNFSTYENELKYPDDAYYVLQPGTTYYWRVAPATSTIPDHKRYKWSPRIEFVVVEPQPEIINPADGESINTISPVFIWKAVEDAEGYQIMVSDNMDFNASLGNVYTYKFTKINSREWRARLFHSAGPDQIPNTDDDFDFFAFYFFNVNLEVGKDYFYRINPLFKMSRNASNYTEFESDIHGFSINSSPLGNEILVNVQPTTKTPEYSERCPTVTKSGDKLAYARLREYQSAGGTQLNTSGFPQTAATINIIPQNFIYYRDDVESEVWYKDIEATAMGVIIGESSSPVSTVVAGSKDIQPCWNPEGTSATFATTKITGSNYIIVSKSIDNALLNIIEQRDRHMTHPQVSNDGKWVAFSDADISGEWYIWIISTESPIKKQVCKGNNPAWSADDSMLTFDVPGQFGNTDIFIIRADGTGMRQLTQSESNVNNITPKFSPDGQKILFTSDRTGNYDLYVIDINGVDLKQVTNFLGDDMEPCWIDDTWIAFTSTRNNNWDIWIGQIPQEQ